MLIPIFLHRSDPSARLSDGERLYFVSQAIDASVSRSDGVLRVEVRATGIAPSGDPQTLFADRRDLTPGVPKPYRGPGLGLPLIGRVVHAWGGRTTAEMADGVLVLMVEVPVR